MRRISIAIDGPAAGGKSTVARRLAVELGYLYVDTGAMYRAVTYLANLIGVDPREEDKVVRIASEMDLRMTPDPASYAGYKVLIGEREITGELHSPAVNERVSPVSRISGVRRVLVELQKAMGKEGGVVMAGRDICTVVLPDAELKIFLTASEEERTRRRFTELQGLGMPQPVKAVREVIRSRDAIDSSREDSPLCVAPDAVVIDTTGRPVDEIVRRIAGLARTLMEE